MNIQDQVIPLSQAKRLTLHIKAMYFNEAISFNPVGRQSVLTEALFDSKLDWIACKDGSILLRDSEWQEVYTSAQFKEDAKRAAALEYSEQEIREIQILTT